MNFVMNLAETDLLKIIKFYRNYAKPNKNDYIRFFAKTDVLSVSVYTTGKVMFQGEDSEAEYTMWQTMLSYVEETPKKKTDKVVLKPKYENYFYSSIGSDEVGTGDFFGPVIVCAAYLDKDNLDYVQTLGIDDSKKIRDDKILQLGVLLKDRITYSLLVLHNDKFNDLTARGFNMNKLKAYLHNKAILNLLAKLDHKPEVIVDQFAEETLYFRYLANEQKVYRDITFMTKAESKFASVGIASILARYAFLKHFDILSQEAGYHLPKGANGEVDKVAARILKDKGEAYLSHFVKMNFKNLDKAKLIVKEQLKR